MHITHCLDMLRADIMCNNLLSRNHILYLYLKTKGVVAKAEEDPNTLRWSGSPVGSDRGSGAVHVNDSRLLTRAKN